jgi:regulation of enolase protein 1 (concanavalin A-like superfamily)
MSHVRGRFLILCLLSSAVVMALDASLLMPGRAHEAAGETFGAGALQYHFMKLTDRFGRMPMDAYVGARAHVEAMKATARARREAQRGASMASAPDLAATGMMSAAAAPASAAATGSSINPDAWRWLGPGNIGGRIRSLVIDPRNPDVMIAGSVGGGIWKTMNGGANWFAADDFMPVLSVSSLVLNPLNPDIVYAGTGEGYGNGDSIRGAGIFKSIDGGNRWTPLASTASDPGFWAVNRLALSPDGKVLLAGTAGGTYRSADGGASFSRIASGIASQDVDFHPADSRKAIASGWGSIAYSRDGGLTWQLADGLPSTASGRIEVAYARSTPDVIYASVDQNNGSLYRSDNGGATFSLVGGPDLLDGQGWYDNAIWVNPANSNDLIVGGSLLRHSVDAGHTWQAMTGLHVDNHVIVEHPQYDDGRNRVLFVGNDGGVYKTADVRPASGAAPSFESLNHDLGVTQFYSGTGNAATGVIMGGTQDNGTLRYVPASGTAWSEALGSDGGYTASDPATPAYFYSETIYLSLYRSTNSGAGFTSIAAGIADAGHDANFVAPFVLDPNNASRMLAGGASLWRTDNVKAASPSWRAITGSAGDDYISAIAVARGDSDVVWIGRSFGRVYRTSNGTAATPAFTLLSVPTNGNFVTRITISPFDSQVVYVTTGSFGPTNVVKTIDGGATWTDATGAGSTGLPDAPVHDLAIDPARPDTIYAATEVGVFVSADGGRTWELPQDGPANVCVDELFWMGSTLVAATHGRGMFAIETGAAGAPAVSMVPNHVDFGSQTVGTTSAPHTITVTNAGSARLEIASVSLIGSQAADFALASGTCAAAALAPGASCSVRLTFDPIAAGTRSVSVRVSSTASLAAETIPASGVGIASPPAASLPAPWTSVDIGLVGPRGRASYANGTFTATGGGADIWDDADAFHFVYQALPADGTIVARVATVQNLQSWTKAGVMVRQSIGAGASHASIFVTPGKGVAFQYRTAAGGPSASTAVAGTAPRWVRLTRADAVVTASVSADGTAWSTLGHATIAIAGPVFVGLAIGSHDAARLATATFDGVSVAAAAVSSSLPADWQTADVGQAGGGSASERGGTFSVAGAGADIWGTADAFRYAYHALPGDGSIVARVATIQDVHAWTKAGVMIRQSLDAGSAHAAMFVSAQNGVAFQRRTASGGISTSTGAAGAAPRWVKLVRAGRIVTASVSVDGSAWTEVAHDTVAISGAVWAGLAVTSHRAGTPAVATFDHVGVTVSAASLPAGWVDGDVGAVGLTGSAAFQAGTFIVSASGADIWDTADAFHFARQTLTGDGQLVARVTDVQQTSRWAKAGVMIRERTGASAAFAFMTVSAAAGNAFQYRSSAGAVAVSIANARPASWVKVVRAGHTVAGYQSSDGVAWQRVGSAAIRMAAQVDIGLAVTSHDNARLCRGTFERVAR